MENGPWVLEENVQAMLHCCEHLFREREGGGGDIVMEVDWDMCLTHVELMAGEQPFSFNFASSLFSDPQLWRQELRSSETLNNIITVTSYGLYKAQCKKYHENEWTCVKRCCVHTHGHEPRVIRAHHHNDCWPSFILSTFSDVNNSANIRNTSGHVDQPMGYAWPLANVLYVPG